MLKHHGEAPKHVGTVLGFSRAYFGDGMGSDGVYYWDGTSVAEESWDDMYSHRTERTIDATPEVQALATAWLRDRVREMIPGIVERLNSERAGTIERGDTVRVIKGRKLPKGTTGKVFWKGETRFGMSVGIALSDRKDANGRNVDVAWSVPGNLEVVDPPTFCLTDAQVELVCDKCATIDCYGQSSGLYGRHGFRSSIEGMVESLAGR